MSPGAERRFLIVTGEASGDLHGAGLVTALGRLGPCRVTGVAGPNLRAAGVESLVPAESLAVVGFSGILAKLPHLLRARRRILDAVRTFRPQVVVLVDYPGFNLRIGPAVRRLGVPVFYYIAPQVWAWHPERARAMAGWVDRLAVVFPFEEALFREAGVATTFVGHPLLDGFGPEIDAASWRRELGAGDGRRILGLLPGSRPQELHHHLAPLLGAARSLCAGRPDLLPVLALAPGLTLPSTVDLGPVVVVRGRTRAVEAHATACLVASGTATLETALFGTPMAILYRTGRLNYALARRLVRLGRIGLPNIVAGADVAPEFLQDQASGERLAAAVAPWLDDPRERARRSEALAVVRERLGGPGASDRAARLLWEMVA